ncbi:MAG TPA: DinB family protein [Cyclobacteriaceae bacterium]|jgi:hypothetical protein|nr:DinB family protein [Cyclobacteriaceae bacterium]
MKKLFLPLVALLLCNFNIAETPLTDQERKFALDHLAQSKEKFLSAIKGLSKEQLNFKSSPESWSVAECAEHIATTESSLFGAVEGALKNPIDASKRSELKMSDDEVLKMITDRSHKVKTNEKFVPSGKYGDIDGITKEFTAKRDAHIEFVKSTKEDFRDRVVTFPYASFDSYQVIVFMSGHTLRHTAQIEEVKANAAFPKK